MSYHVTSFLCAWSWWNWMFRTAWQHKKQKQFRLDSDRCEPDSHSEHCEFRAGLTSQTETFRMCYVKIAKAESGQWSFCDFLSVMAGEALAKIWTSKAFYPFLVLQSAFVFDAFAIKQFFRFVSYWISSFMLSSRRLVRLVPNPVAVLFDFREYRNNQNGKRWLQTIWPYLSVKRKFLTQNMSIWSRIGEPLHI